MQASTQFNSVRSIALVAALAASTAFAHATSITYTLAGVATNKGTLTGTIDIDTLTKLVTAADITFNYADAGNPVFTDIGTPTVYDGLGQDSISGPSNSPLNDGGQITLYYDIANLGLDSFTICVHSQACGSDFNQASYAQTYSKNNQGGPIFITGGSLANTGDPVPAATPEPSSFLLLGTGILGIAALMARQRFRNA
jgi:hypothetical protein